MTAVPEALDAYVAAVRRVTGGPVPQLNPPRERSAVRRILEELVEDPLEELIDLWSWHDGEMEPLSAFFWTGGGTFHRVDRVRQLLPEVREFLDDDRATDEAVGEEWPFAIDDVVPVVWDGMELTLVDSGSGPGRGLVYNHATSAATPPFVMFTALTDAVDAACYCVDAGYWIPDVHDGLIRYMLAPLRSTAASPLDLTSPPFPMSDPSNG